MSWLQGIPHKEIKIK